MDILRTPNMIFTIMALWLSVTHYIYAKVPNIVVLIFIYYFIYYSNTSLSSECVFLWRCLRVFMYVWRCWCSKHRSIDIYILFQYIFIIRVCISVVLPQGIHVRVEMLVCRSSKDDGGGVVTVGRSSMHVQSHSEWAPANIGPYSQAYTVSKSVY